MDLSFEERRLLWSMSKTTRALLKWYNRALKLDIEDEAAVDAIRSELESINSVHTYLDEVLNGSKSLDRDKIHAMMNEEREAVKVERLLERKDQLGELEMSGNRGVEYIKALRELTKSIIEYEEIVNSRPSDDMPKAPSEVETEAARYILTYQEHGSQAVMSDEMYEACDCIVLEVVNHEVSSPPVRELGEPGATENVSEPMHRLMCRNLVGKQKPVFLPDMNLSGYSHSYQSKDGFRDDINRFANEFGGMAPWFTAALSSLGLSSIAGSITYLNAIGGVSAAVFATVLALRLADQMEVNVPAELRLITFYTPGAMRSAVVAEKIEQYLGPELESRKGEKPTLYLNYGLGHRDLELFLKRPQLRELVIKLHATAGYPTMKPESRNTITEFRFGTGDHTGRTTYKGEELEYSWMRFRHKDNMMSHERSRD